MSTENQQEQAEKAMPTKEEVMSFLSEQIEVKELQLKLQELNASLAMARMEELKAMAYIAQLTNPREEAEEETEVKQDRKLKK